MIRFFCQACCNDNDEKYDIYTRTDDLCNILTIVCKQCGNTKEILVSSELESFCRDEKGGSIIDIKGQDF